MRVVAAFRIGEGGDYELRLRRMPDMRLGDGSVFEEKSALCRADLKPAATTQRL
jgi:hypothetical protein